MSKYLLLSIIARNKDSNLPLVYNFTKCAVLELKDSGFDWIVKLIDLETSEKITTDYNGLYKLRNSIFGFIKFGIDKVTKNEVWGITEYSLCEYELLQTLSLDRVNIDTDYIKYSSDNTELVAVNREFKYLNNFTIKPIKNNHFFFATRSTNLLGNTGEKLNFVCLRYIDSVLKRDDLQFIKQVKLSSETKDSKIICSFPSMNFSYKIVDKQQFKAKLAKYMLLNEELS